MPRCERGTLLAALSQVRSARRDSVRIDRTSDLHLNEGSEMTFRRSILALGIAFLLPACAPETDESIDGDFDTGEPMAETQTDDATYGDPYGETLTDETGVQLTLTDPDRYGAYIY